MGIPSRIRKTPCSQAEPHTPREPPASQSSPPALTGAFLDAAALPQRVPAQLAVEILLPELGKPDVPAVVVQGPAGEVAVETCPGRKWMEGINPRDDREMHHTLPNSPGRGEGWGRQREAVVSDGDTPECGGILSKVSLVQRCKWKIHSGKILCKAETFWDSESSRNCLSRCIGDKERVGKTWHMENKEVIDVQIRSLKPMVVSQPKPAFKESNLTSD